VLSPAALRPRARGRVGVQSLVRGLRPLQHVCLRFRVDILLHVTLTLNLKVTPHVRDDSPCKSEHFTYNVDI
jgi:hypothetical protein